MSSASFSAFVAMPATLSVACPASDLAVSAAVPAALFTLPAAAVAASVPTVVAVLSAEVAVAITSAPVVRVSIMVRPAPISRAAPGLVRADSARLFTTERLLSRRTPTSSAERAEVVMPSRSWPRVLDRPARWASASRWSWALSLMSGSPSPCGRRSAGMRWSGSGWGRRRRESSCRPSGRQCRPLPIRRRRSGSPRRA